MNAIIHSGLPRALAVTSVTVLLILGGSSEAMARGRDGHGAYERGPHHGQSHHRGQRHWKGHHRPYYRYPRHYYGGHYDRHYYGYPYGIYGLGVLTGILLDGYYYD